MGKVVYNACYGGFGFSRAATERLAEMGVPGAREALKADCAYLFSFGAANVPRHDARLVRVVEEMGKAASGGCADLCVEDLGAGERAYSIAEHDGKERVVPVDCDGVAGDDARDLLRRIAQAWRDDEIGQIDGALIEEAEALLGITPEAECPRCGGSMPADDGAECMSAGCVAFRGWAASQPQDDEPNAAP